MAKRPLVRVEWLDAHGSAAAQTTYTEDAIPHAPARVWTYGLLLKDDTVGVSIAGELFEDGSFRQYTFIPRGMVVRLETVTPTRRQRSRAKLAPVEAIAR